MRRLLMAWLVAALVATLAPTVSGQTAELVSGEPFAATLFAINNDQASFALADGETAVATADLVRWGEPAAPAARPTVFLRRGSRLVAAPMWSRGGSIRFGEGVFTVRQTLLSRAQIPRAEIRAIHFEAVRDRDLFAPIIREARRYSGPADRVWLTSGDALSGNLTKIENNRLTLSVDEQPLEIELNQVVLIRLATPPSDEPPAAATDEAKPTLAIGLSDGGVLLAESIEAGEGDRLSVRLPSGLTLAQLRTRSITLVQPLSQRTAYLSDLEPIDYRHTPQFDLAWRYGRDENLFGQGLRCAGGRWLKGLSMHSAARLVYRVPAGASRLICDVGIDDSATPGGEPTDRVTGGSVVFRALVARDGKFQQDFESQVVRSGDAPLRVSVDVDDAQAVALVVDFADGGDTLDHADWLGARFEW